MSPDSSTRADLADALNSRHYQLWNVAWFKVFDVQKALTTREADRFRLSQEEAALLRGWLSDDAAIEPWEKAQHYVDEELRSVMPEDSIWGELCSDEDEIRWRVMTDAPRARVAHILAYNYFHGEGYNPKKETCRVWAERPPTSEEAAWYRDAEEGFFRLFPPATSHFFEPVPRAVYEDDPWEIPQIVVAVTRDFAGAVFHHANLWENDYRPFTG